MRLYVDKKYFKWFISVNILGDGFLGKYYITLFKAVGVSSLCTSKYYVIVENIEKPIHFELKTVSHIDKYVVFSKNDLKNNIPNDLYNLLVKRGLYNSAETGYSKNNSRCGHYRLVACLYQNILGKEIHHIYKNIGLNDITNIVPIEKPLHEAPYQ